MYTIIIGQRSTPANNAIALQRPAEVIQYPAGKTYKNVWTPQYRAWTDFTKRTGLFHVFYGENGLMENQPDCVALTYNELHAFEDAMKQFQDRNPNVLIDDHGDVDESANDFDRLEFLCFWTKWALNHCAEPVLWNF